LLAVEDVNADSNGFVAQNHVYGSASVRAIILKNIFIFRCKGE
jgi:hypothetical protein